MSNKYTSSYNSLTELLKRVEEKLTIFENKKLQYKTTRLKLADGKMICVKTPFNQIPHMLGFHTDNVSSSLYRGRGAYTLLKQWIDNPYDLFQRLSRREIHPDLISDKIDAKLEGFLENCLSGYDVDELHKIEWVLEYDKSKNYGNFVLNDSFDIAIKKVDKDGHVYLLKLVKVNRNGYDDDEYQPVSSLYYETEEEFRKENDSLLKNQVITYPVTINSAAYSDGKPKVLFIPDKKRKLAELNKVAERTGAIVASSVDHFFGLRIQEEKYNANDYLKNVVVDAMCAKMTKYEIITPADLGVESFDAVSGNLIRIIAAYNEIAKAIKIVSNQSDIEQYNKLKSRIDTLQELVSQYKEKNKSLTTEVNNLKIENASLLEQNLALQEKIAKYERAITSMLEIGQGAFESDDTNKKL